MNIKDGINRRFITSESLAPVFTTEEREADGGAKLVLKGTPIVYGRETVLYEDETFKWTETIEAGASREALLRAEQVLLWNHDSAKPLAARKNNTLTAREDSNGVHIEADVAASPWGDDAYRAIKAGLVDKMSFGFYIKDEGYTTERSVENGKRIYKRTIKKFDRIVDFSPVTYPAYEDTDISARDAAGLKAEIEAVEKAAREKLDAVNAETEAVIARTKLK